MKKLLVIPVSLLLLMAAAPAWSCAALIGARGSLQLGKTSTLSAYVDGKEHYITSFEFSGGGGEFGSIVPLPGIPEKIEKGGGWTLQRLERETQPVLAVRAQSGSLSSGSAPPPSAEVVQEVRIEALDITILRGGGSEVGVWAKDHGFLLPPDAPAVLDFYASRSPIFMAAIFDATAAAERGQQTGDGTPIHLTIPTDNPWVPLRILTLGKTPEDSVDAAVYLLTQRKPALLPVRAKGLELRLREPASESLLADLRSDAGMEWLPAKAMWLSYFEINAEPSQLRFDLAADASGKGKPSYRMAGLREPVRPAPVESPVPSPSPTPEPTPAPSPPVREIVVASAEEQSNSVIKWVGLAAVLVASLAFAGTRVVSRRTR
jgi:hypothetical protein